jgi:hypothetical protein
MQFADVLNRKLEPADAVQILGAVYFYLREKDVVRSVPEMHANNAAQGTILTLRQNAFESAYPKDRN